MMRLEMSTYLAQVLMMCTTVLALGGYDDPFQNFSNSAYSSVSFSHSHRVFHPPPKRQNFDNHLYQFRQSFGEEFGNQGGGGGFGNYLGYHKRPYYGQNVDNSLLGGFPYGGSPQQQTCPLPVFGPCKKSKYRSIDGSCNNLRNPSQGISSSNYNRLLPQKYSDGLHLPPVSITGHKLPSARLISIVLFPDHNIPDPVWTLVTMQWGQIITHDMSMAMGTTQTKPLANQCCSADGRLQIPHGQAPAQCFAIDIPIDDPLYSKFGQMCMNFMRSTTDVERGCVPSHGQPHEQIVVVTHYMDASFIYGSNQQTNSALREGVGGRLRVDVRYGRQWPPSANNKTATCAAQNDNESCFLFGDVRGNQNPQLTVLQILYLREHNRVADMLQHLNPHWNDEKVFQEARRIVIAAYQHVNYYEWLPIFLGTKNMMKYGLLYRTDDYVNDYREDIDASVLNGHATAAFRYFHSAIQGQLHMVKEERSINGALRLSDFFNRPNVIEENDNMDSLTRGMATQSQEEVDPFVTSEITDFLFRNGMPFGRDLKAIDVQRGRDHGLASYNDYRHFCGLPKAKTFEDFGDYIAPEVIEKLALLYAHPDDVDLAVGGSLERHVEDTLSGPTFLCIMLEQFYRTRVGDRFFYENGNHPNAFTPEQLREIRKATISRLFCDNGDHIQYMQPEGFRVIGNKNPLLPCEDTRAIPTIDLSLWKEIPQEQHFHPYDFFGKK